MTLLYLVRHGETIDNAHHIMQGQTQGELNEKGIKQAQEVAEQLKNEPIDAFVSSDLRRSIHTCEIIAAPMISLFVQLHYYVSVTGEPSPVSIYLTYLI